LAAAAALVASGGTLNPVGILTLNSGLSLGGSAQFNIAGLTAGADYDRVTLTNTAGTATYTLTYGGDLNLNFSASAANGDYTLFATGTNVTRSGTFATVALTGTYSGSLTPSGTTWSGTVGGKTFSFDETTGVLSVSGGVAPVEAWRSANFPGSTPEATAATLAASFMASHTQGKVHRNMMADSSLSDDQRGIV
jgi:hypothetical protein